MIKINFNEPQNDPDWLAWREKCATETENLKKDHEEGNEWKIKSTIYKDNLVKKKYYFNDDFGPPFYRKCAYCESSIGNENGDMEHYRPKKGVADFNGNVDDHPGYYWLAYDWENLFPSCVKCNRLYNWKRTDGDQVTGKKNLFPLEPGSQRAYTPDDNLAIERPLIIHPLKDDPEEHLDLELNTGTMIWKTPRGEATVHIFGMNIRDNILDGRKMMISHTRDILAKLLISIENQDKDRQKLNLESLLDLVKGKKNYSFASRKALRNFIGDDYQDWITSRLEKLENEESMA